MKVISTEKKPIKMWIDKIEDGALEQAKNLANLPFIHKHVAIMPDSHQGYGMPIGGVIATKGVIIPNAVGVDIGCGMCATRTSLKELDIETIKKIFGGSKEYKGGIRTRVPVGFKHHSKKQDERLMPELDFNNNECPIVKREYFSALNQIGTLGGGNHFIEIQKGSDDHIWVMIHSGSRNIGYKVAKHYNDLAIELNNKWHSKVPIKWELAFLPLESEEGHEYLKEMQYCIDFALANRELIMERIKISICEVIDTEFDNFINIAHNYASIENHFGKNVVVHRKGATLSRKGIKGIIPGSQGTKSYIVTGKGNPESFMSCSHGAGRVMSRKKAQNTLNLDEEKNKLDSMGIIHSIRNKNDLDEASSAYKDIDIVMDNQKDLVDIDIELKPLGVIKG